MVTEGEVTEPEYLRGLERQVRTSVVEVEIASKHGEPKKVVEIAKELKLKAAGDARRHGDLFLAFDEVWCVFDRDAHPRFDDACVMARDNCLKLAVSNPCFELWLLLHFRDNPGAQQRAKLGQMLAAYLPGYDKHVAFEQLASGLDKATERARRLDTDAREQNDQGRNPTTGMYRLTDSIRRE